MPLRFFDKISRKTTALLMFGIFLFSSTQAAELSDIQKQIKLQEEKIAAQKQEQDKLQSNLRDQEMQISNALTELRQTETDLQETRKIINETNKQIKQLEKQEQQQKAKLAKQIDSIYRSGNPSAVIEHLISNDAQKADRMKVYYQHMNQARMALIADLKATRAQLTEQKDSLATQQKSQQSRLLEKRKQQQDLQKARNERQSTLTQLNRSLTRDQNKLERLKANESALQREINRAEKDSNEQVEREREALAQKTQREEQKNNKPYEPTEQEQRATRPGSGLQGKYGYPVAGRIVTKFGSTQVGELKWKGIVINANAGAPVKAIADGRVILSNWLQGYGLVVVVDHGKGDMSLYGYNQSVAVKTGTVVRAGQKIAEVGSSGGQGRSSLYFEIRRQGNAVNPLNWLK